MAVHLQHQPAAGATPLRFPGAACMAGIAQGAIRLGRRWLVSEEAGPDKGRKPLQALLGHTHIVRGRGDAPMMFPARQIRIDPRPPPRPSPEDRMGLFQLLYIHFFPITSLSYVLPPAVLTYLFMIRCMYSFDHFHSSSCSAQPS